MIEQCETFVCFLDKHADGIGCLAVIIVCLLADVLTSLAERTRKCTKEKTNNG